ncbi:hypothetical protein FCH28_37665 [Streptomyces piniterrae]|uniref:Uncharacterized protein n=1 Tax=Streptomyces piniterrae TaxID=2571125 RepID=A0A4U0MKL4_9ACTN|nr:hypothetical protein [Streptomyces piniterrae]TJZ41215.1 hypothetical protein FCH28_37665 [Streptomyces piniterrae]
MLFDTSALPAASGQPTLPYAEDAVTFIHVSVDGTVNQAREFEGKQAMLAELHGGMLLAVWTQQHIATVYAVDSLGPLRRAMGVHGRTAGRSYHSAPAELEARREGEAERFEAQPCRTCEAPVGEVCRTQTRGVAAYYHRGRDGSTSGTAKVPKSRTLRL